MPGAHTHMRKQAPCNTSRVRGGPRAIQMLKHPLKGAGSHPLTQAKSAQHCSATRRLPCKRAHITWPSGQHGRYSALVPCSNHMPHTFNTHSTHTLLSTHSTHTLLFVSVLCTHTPLIGLFCGHIYIFFLFCFVFGLNLAI